MRLRKLIRAVVVFLVVCVLGAAYAVENLLPYYGIKPYRMIAAENLWRFPNGYQPENFQLHGRKIVVNTRDSIVLQGWFLETDRDTARGTVIVLHGISSCKETQFGRARLLAQNGYNCVALDLRAHGESGGDFCTFGFYEKYDLQSTVDTVLAMTHGAPVGIWGASLGGAIALQAMDLDHRIAFGIIESTFDEFEKVAEEYGADWMFGVRSKTLTSRVLGKSARIARFDPATVKPVEAAARIDRPMLFMHGDADDKIPIEFNRRNYEAVPAAEKQWITVAGGGHSNLWGVDGPNLERAVSGFLGQRSPR